jgi:hypothetical protein
VTILCDTGEYGQVCDEFRNVATLFASEIQPTNLACLWCFDSFWGRQLSGAELHQLLTFVCLLIKEKSAGLLRNVKLKPKCFKTSLSVDDNDRLFEVLTDLDQKLGSCHSFTQLQVILSLRFENSN